MSKRKFLYITLIFLYKYLQYGIRTSYLIFFRSFFVYSQPYFCDFKSPHIRCLAYVGVPKKLISP